MSFDTIRAAFEARGAPMRPRGDGFTTTCPAHDDANASLSCEPGTSGAVVVRCFAGCKFDAIAAALGVPKREWFAPRQDAQRSRDWVIRAVDGTALAVHRRLDRPDGSKTVLWFGPDGRTPSKRGTPCVIDPRKLPLYGVHDLPPTGTVVVTEGEKAADALRFRGIPAVGTVCGAASIPCDESLAVLAGRDVVLWPDNDEPGVSHMARIAARLADPPRVVVWPKAPPKGDAADCDDPMPLIAAAVSSKPPSGESEADEPHTDLGIARRFIARYGDEFRCLDQSHWMRWNGSHWSRSANAQVIAAVAAVARSVSVAAGGDEITAKAARKQESSSRINGAVSLAAAHEPFRVSTESVDRIPYLLACRNCVVDLRTGIPVPAARTDLLSRHIPHDYDPAAKAPTWERFLLEVCAGRAELVGFLRRFAGYCLTGEVREHALALLTGGGRNGKSTFVEALMHVFGDELAGPAAPGLLIASKNERHPTEIMDLHGKRLVVASEVPKHGAFSEERVKWLTGGDQVKARAMRADFVSFRPTHKFILCTNHLPAVKDPTEGFWRRVRVVPFDVDFKGREDRTLPERLRGETQGILAWLVRAAVEWRTHGLGEPVAVAAATAEYRSDEDTLGRFLDQYLPGSTEERPASQILAAYRAWCEQEGERGASSAKALAADLAALGWRKRKSKACVMWSRPGPPPAAPEPPAGVTQDDADMWADADAGYVEEPE